jgi:tocopherol O-methyltransferase
MLLKEKIIQHYDEISPYYRDLWGVHIQHGYWKTGLETKEEAQEQLIEQLISRAQIQPRATILDVGCGLGGTAIYLHKKLGGRVTGVTVSPRQIQIGNELALSRGADVRLVLMDAETLTLDGSFDVVWSVEAISHLGRKADCFRSMARLLKDGGKLVIADWFRSYTASLKQEREFLHPIERAMLVPKLEPPSVYMKYVTGTGLNVIEFEDLSTKVQKTWDLAIDLIKKPALWKLAATRGSDFSAFLQGFRAMRAGYKSKTLVYGVLIGQKK